MNDRLDEEALRRGLATLTEAARSEAGSFATDDGVVHRLLNNVWGSALLCIGPISSASLVFNTDAPVTCLGCLAKGAP